MSALDVASIVDIPKSTIEDWARRGIFPSRKRPQALAPRTTSAARTSSTAPAGRVIMIAEKAADLIREDAGATAEPLAAAT